MVGVAPVRVFISYAYDSREHGEDVRALVELLRTQGIDAWLDRYAEDEPRDWSLWMMEQFRKADFVIVVASPAYRRRADGLADPGEGVGVQFEAAILRDLFMGDPGTWSAKVLTVLLPGATIAEIPHFLGPYTRSRYPVTLTEMGVERVVRVLTGQAEFPVPPVGPVSVLPAAPSAIPPNPGKAEILAKRRQATVVSRRALGILGSVLLGFAAVVGAGFVIYESRGPEVSPPANFANSSAGSSRCPSVSSSFATPPGHQESADSPSRAHNGLTLTVNRVYNLSGIWCVDLAAHNETGNPVRLLVSNFRFYGPAGDDPHAGDPGGSAWREDLPVGASVTGTIKVRFAVKAGQGEMKAAFLKAVGADTISVPIQHR